MLYMETRTLVEMYGTQFVITFYQLSKKLKGSVPECSVSRKACNVDSDIGESRILCQYGNLNWQLPYLFELTEALKDSTF